MERKTGYFVWIFADRFWHRSYAAAESRALRARNYCGNVQVIEVATGELLYGRSE